MNEKVLKNTERMDTRGYEDAPVKEGIGGRLGDHCCGLWKMDGVVAWEEKEKMLRNNIKGGMKPKAAY